MPTVLRPLLLAVAALVGLSACADTDSANGNGAERVTAVTAGRTDLRTESGDDQTSATELPGSIQEEQVPSGSTTQPDDDISTTSVVRSSVENGETLTDDIQMFWTRSGSEFGIGEFEWLPPERIVAIFVADGTGVQCDGEELYGDEVFDNAFASICDEGYLVAYDQAGLMEQLLADIGPTAPAIVLAHEWGHIAQFQADTFLSPVIAEQQADCLAGAWAADAFERRYAPMDSASSMDEAVQAALANADPPGESALDIDAHGNGFDRVRAFQEGFERGVSFCAEYEITPPPLFEVPFSSGFEEQTGGNLPLFELLDATATDLADYFADVDGTDPNLTPEDLYSPQDLEQLHRELGDNGLLTALAMQWGVEGNLDTVGLLERACLVGGWMQLHVDPVDEEIVTLSPGDLDEAIAALVRLSAVDRNLGEPGLLFETVAAMRLGVISGTDACP